MTSQQRNAVPYYVIEGAMNEADEDDNYAVCASDGDISYARTYSEAHAKRRMRQVQLSEITPVKHSVVIVKLQEASNE